MKKVSLSLEVSRGQHLLSSLLRFHLKTRGTSTAIVSLIDKNFLQSETQVPNGIIQIPIYLSEFTIYSRNRVLKQIFVAAFPTSAFSISSS